ncbi:MAG: nucleoside monophosphate kinase [Candidatus Paceibacterota bacterium]|jgi:adenylate kinase family enzyme
MDKKAFIFIGRSGCGKGTQAKLLVDAIKDKKDENVYYVATGDEFRKVLDAGTYMSSRLKEVVGKGGFAPSFAATLMWSTALFRDLKENDHVMIDGSPRSLSEAQVLDSVFPFLDLAPVVIYINVSREWASDRLRARGRHDDSDTGINSRMNLFESDIIPVLEFYKSREYPEILEINGEQHIDDVHEDLKKALGL